MVRGVCVSASHASPFSAQLDVQSMTRLIALISCMFICKQPSPASNINPFVGGNDHADASDFLEATFVNSLTLLISSST